MILPNRQPGEASSLPSSASRQIAGLWIASVRPRPEFLNIFAEVQVVSAGEAWPYVAGMQHKCGLIVLAEEDYQLSLSFFQRLRSHPDKYDLPSLILVPDRRAAEAAIDAGVDDFCLSKNALEELPARIRQCVMNFEQAQRVAWQLHEQQREIAESHLLTEKIVDALPVSLYVVDRELRIVAWNRNREIGGQGIERRQVLGRHICDVFSKMPRERLEAEISQVFTTGESMRFEQESQADGSNRCWVISKIPIRLNDQEIISHVMTIGEEITDQKKMNAAILHAEKLAGIGRLASGIVHEINNPLATIAACSEALQSRLAETEASPLSRQDDFQEYLKLINDETFRCKAITDNLLEFSGHRASEKKSLEINYLVEQTLRLVKHHPKLKQLPLKIDLQPQLPSIDANEAQIKQVFIALITNACDALQEVTGRLQIRTYLENLNGKTLVCTEFTDNGIGIPPEIQPTIFDPFVTTKPFGQGTGLGLAVCYGIVSDHGGKIEVQSQSGEGTTMKVLLPVATGVSSR